jgi:CMP-N-acetylneuraminic acid synthetase
MIIFIPIKKSSQRVRGKNFRKLPNGKPLWLHTVEKLNEFKVVIDTDSEKIKKETEAMSNVNCYMRSDRLIGHDVSVCDLIEDFVKREKYKGIITQIHVTSPFLSPKTIKNAIHYLDSYDSVVSCTVLKERLWRKEKYGYCPVNHNPLKLEQTQDLPEILKENSCFYCFREETILRSKNRIGINPMFYNIQHPEDFDIDTEEDWKKLEEMF